METLTEINPELFYLEQSVKSKLFTVTNGAHTGPAEQYVTLLGDDDFGKLCEFRDYMNEHHQKNEELTRDGLRLMYYTLAGSSTDEKY